MAKDIHEAIHAVMQEVGYVQKTRSQEGGVNYKYAGEAALIEALRPAMVTAGIYMHVTEAPDVFRETYTTSNGKPMNRTAIRLKVRFTHAPSGTSIDTEAWGEGSDVGDKSTPKAMTGAYKYALRETFCIETGDDPDDHSSTKQQRSAPNTTVRSNGPPPAQPEGITDAQKKLAHTLASEYAKFMGGMAGVEAAMEKLPPAVTQALAFAEDGKLVWRVGGLSKRDASAFIEALKAEQEKSKELPMAAPPV